jgi:hypothetical protein
MAVLRVANDPKEAGISLVYHFQSYSMVTVRTLRETNIVMTFDHEWESVTPYVTSAHRRVGNMIMLQMEDNACRNGY